MNTKEKRYEEYLLDFIPITRSMNLSVIEYQSRQTIIRAGIEENKSKKDFAFGGSIVSLCLASAWSLLQCRMEEEEIEGVIVINKQDTKFRLPITSDFEATSRFESEENWVRFKEMLGRMRRGRVTINSEVFFDQKLGATFNGIFAVVKD